MHEINVTLTPSTVTIQDSDGPQGPAGPAGPQGATGPAGPVTVAPSATAPVAPAVGDVWLSSRVIDSMIDPSPSGRAAIKASPGFEPSMWYHDGLYHMVYTHGTQLRQGSSVNPMDAAGWTFGAAFLGAGAGGFANDVGHSGVYIEGSTLYLYFVDTEANAVRVATAALSAPTVWTVSGTVILPGSAVGDKVIGNVVVVKDASTYRLFVEYLKTDTLPGDGVTNSWQTGMATSTAPTSAFTLAIDAYTTLRVSNGSGAGGSVSGCWVGKEGEMWVMIYHGGSWARSLPNDIYRATSTNLATDSWTITDRGLPFVRRAADVEVDQVADPFVCAGPSTKYLVWEGYNNRTQASVLMCAPLQPVLQQWDGARWVRVAGVGTQASSRPVDGPWQVDNSPLHRGVRKVGTWVSEQYAASINNARRYNSSAADGDSIEYDVILSPGSWTLAWYKILENNNGIVDIDIDDGGEGWYITQIASVDTYAASTTNNSFSEHTFTVYGTETIRRSLRFKVDGKNASSSGFYMKDMGWYLRRTDV